MKNDKLANEKGLIIDNSKSIYDEVVYKYKYVLEYFISTIIDFKKYEDEINNSNLYIGKNSKYKNLNNYLNLNYIFLINNLFVEKLSVDDIKFLRKKFNKDNITDEMLDMIKRTYKDVIYDNYLRGEYQNTIYKVCYGSVVPFNFVDNNALVFKIYYGKNLIDKDGDAFIELHQKQLDFLEKLKTKLKSEIKEKLDINCEILQEKDLY